LDPPPDEEVGEVEVQAKLSELDCHLQVVPLEHSNVSVRDALRSQVPWEVGPFERDPSAVEIDCEETRVTVMVSRAPNRKNERILRAGSVVVE